MPRKRAVKKFGVGIFLDFASPSTRTPRGACVRMGGRNRVGRHWGEIERLVARTVTLPASPRSAYLQAPRPGTGQHFRV